ncbi:chaplin [Streptomyces sp. 891-h]|uniref:chaplin n=1 Tax=unclassified Streptomyces TaxID=2593676 RepID=UPI001FAB2DFF|nr:chaplin [Streptomyces sp. 891-h]UNZ20566.1 chaplin [Streptomyces sp. 891-h]
MRIRTAIAVGALCATALLGSTAGTAVADDPVVGKTGKSPGNLSGDNIQIPVNVGTNVCGNPILLPLLSPAAQNYCKNKF